MKFDFWTEKTELKKSIIVSIITLKTEDDTYI